MEDPPPAPALVGCQGLEQFLLLAKTAKGPAVCELIKQTLEAPGVYVFGELLETECVKELASGTHANYVQLLEIFAFGTYRDYKKTASSLPALTPAQCTKLKHLTIVSLAAKHRTIPYATLLEELDISDLRELEDLIIEAIYAGLIQAKLNQKNSQLEVECFIGRDIKMEALSGMMEKLENWCSNCASVLQDMEEQMHRANQMKQEQLKAKEKHEQDIKTMKQTVKVAASSKDDDMFGVQREPAPKSHVKKGIRGSGAMKMFTKK